MNTNFVYQFYADHALVQTYKSVGAATRHGRLRKSMHADTACVVKEMERVYLLGGTENDYELAPTGRELILRAPMLTIHSDDVVEDDASENENELVNQATDSEIVIDMDGFTDEELAAVL